MSCTCHNCGRKYKVDLLVPNEIWHKIKPPNSSNEGGLLCPICIAERLENLNGYDYWILTKDKVGDKYDDGKNNFLQ